MLLTQNEVFRLLRCPISGSKLKQKNTNSLVADNNKEFEYEIIKGYPILVDFEHSVLSKEDVTRTEAKSIIQRHSYTGISGLIRRVVSPPKRSTAKNVKEIVCLLKKGKPEPKVLIIGGATIGQGMDIFYTSNVIKVISFDIYASPYVQFVADAHSIPLSSGCVDCAIIQTVLEHVLEPQKVVSEIHRVLKPKGIVYAETPFLQYVHEGPYDFTRFTESGHRYLFKDFELIKSGASGGPGTQLLWSIDYLFHSLFRSRAIGKGFKILFFWLQYLDSLIPDSYSVDGASAVYFLGHKKNSPIIPKSIIDHYKGVYR